MFQLQGPLRTPAITEHAFDKIYFWIIQTNYNFFRKIFYFYWDHYCLVCGEDGEVGMGGGVTGRGWCVLEEVVGC